MSAHRAGGGNWEEVRVVAQIAAPVSNAFAYVSDYRTWPTWVMGLQSLEATTEQTHGVGTELESVTEIGPIKLKNKGHVVTCDLDERFSIEADGIIQVRATMEFRAPSPEVTELSVAIAYLLPGGLRGQAISPLIPPFLKMALRQSEVHLRTCLEEQTGIREAS